MANQDDDLAKRRQKIEEEGRELIGMFTKHLSENTLRQAKEEYVRYLSDMRMLTRAAILRRGLTSPSESDSSRMTHRSSTIQMAAPAGVSLRIPSYARKHRISVQCQYATNPAVSVLLVAAREVPHKWYAVCCTPEEN